MKQLLMAMMVSLTLLTGGAMAYADNTATANNPSGVVKHVFGVHGLSCPFCVIGVKKTFKKIQGVRSVDVSLKNNTVTVYTVKGKCFSDQELKALFNQAGFSYHGTISKPKTCG